MQGVFISFEGIDGAGKSSHIETVANALIQQGRTVVRTREPGGTALAEQVRQLLLHAPMDSLTEALLAFAARRDHLNNVIVPALERGDVVLSDRFTDATFAYQGGGGGLDWNILTQLESLVQTYAGTLLQPHLTVWFDVDPAVAAQRLVGVRLPDKFEAQPLNYFEKVRAGYQERMHRDAQRFVRLDAGQAPQAVAADLLAALQGMEWFAC
jgi:dTMP kinase